VSPTKINNSKYHNNANKSYQKVSTMLTHDSMAVRSGSGVGD